MKDSKYSMVLNNLIFFEMLFSIYHIQNKLASTFLKTSSIASINASSLFFIITYGTFLSLKRFQICFKAYKKIVFFLSCIKYKPNIKKENVGSYISNNVEEKHVKHDQVIKIKR